MNGSPILYAEDDENDIYFVQRAFKDAAVSNPLVVVLNGQEVLDYFEGSGEYANRQEHPLPCLLLLDLNMPEKSGLDVLKWIRSTPAHCTLPVIMLTSSTADADMHRAYILGANGFLVKPGSPKELLAMVKAIRDFWLVHNRGVGDCLIHAKEQAATIPQFVQCPPTYHDPQLKTTDFPDSTDKQGFC